MNTSTGVFTLTANKTYRLFGSLGFVNFTSITGWMLYEWVDATTNAALDNTGSSVGVAEALNRDVSEFNATSANLIYTPNTNQTIKLRITASGGNASIRSAIGTKAIIEQINPTVTVNNGSSGTSGESGNAPVTGSWNLTTGANSVSFTVPAGQSYVMWVNGNIPNGIVNWNATVTLSNSNVPVVGAQYGWYYLAGNALALTSIPNQIVGTVGTISTSSPAVSNSNSFTFGITNNSGSPQIVYYGYTKVS